MSDIRKFTTIEEFEAEEALMRKESEDIDALNEKLSVISDDREKTEFVHGVHDKYSYVRYDYLNDEFRYYELRAYNVILHKELFINEKKKRNIHCLDELGDEYIDSQISEASMLHFLNCLDEFALVDLS